MVNAKPRTFADQKTVFSRTFQGRLLGLLAQYFIIYVGLKYTRSTLP